MRPSDRERKSIYMEASSDFPVSDLLSRRNTVKQADLLHTSNFVFLTSNTLTALSHSITITPWRSELALEEEGMRVFLPKGEGILPGYPFCVPEQSKKM